MVQILRSRLLIFVLLFAVTGFLGLPILGVEPVVFEVRKVLLVDCEHPLHVRLDRSLSCNLLVGVY